MTILNQFWLLVLETILLPIYQFFGYDAGITLVVLILFTAMQIWIFWHLFFKPFIYVCKIFLNLFNKNYLFTDGVEVDEKNSKKCK